MITSDGSNPGPEDMQYVRGALAGLQKRHRSLRASYDLLKAYIEGFPAAAFLKQPGDKGRYVLANTRLAIFANTKVKEIIGKTDAQLWPVAVADRMANLDRAAIESQSPVHADLSIADKDGPHFRMCCRFPVRSRLGHSYVGGWMAAPADGLVRFAGSEAIGIVYGEGDRIVQANDVFLEMLGYTRDDLAAGALTLSADDNILREPAAGGVWRPKEKQLVRKDGGKTPVFVAGAVLESAPKPGWVFYTLDISEQKRLDSRVRRDQAWQSLGAIATGLAHDLNNLLVVMMGNASMAAGDPNLSEKSRNYLAEVLSAAGQAAELMHRMLVYSGKARLVPGPVRLGAVMDDVRRGQAVPNGVRVDVDFPDDLPPALGDATHLTEALRSLFVNAVEAAAPDGTVRVRAGVRQIPGTMIVADVELPPGEYVSVTVEDTGSGMDETVRERIFDPFFTTKFPGRGLGLAAAYGIVRRHGGAISVESRRGHGSRFEVLLPGTGTP
jgi:PAS domain S-box-containing protein